MSSISGDSKKKRHANNGNPERRDDDAAPSKQCGQCGTGNPMATRFCISCGKAFPGAAPDDKDTELFPVPGKPNDVSNDTAHQSELAEARRALESLRIKAEAEIKAAKEEAAQATSRLQNGEKRLADVMNQVQAVAANVREMENMLSARTEELAQANAKVDALNAQITGLRSDLEAANAEAELAKSRLASVQASSNGDPAKDAEILRLSATLANAEREDQRLAHELSKALDEIKTAEADAKTLTQAREAAFAEINDLRGQLETAQQDLGKAAAELNEAKAAHDKFRQEAKAFADRQIADIAAKDQQIADLQTRIQQLEATIQTMPPGNANPASTAELEDLRRQLAIVEAEHARAVAAKIEAMRLRDEANRKQAEAEAARVQAEAAANKKWFAEFEKHRDAVNQECSDKLQQAETERAEAVRILEEERDGLLARINRPTWLTRNRKHLLALVFTVMAVALVVFNKSTVLGWFATPVLIPASSENLQKFFMQGEPTCLKGKVTAPSPDTLGIVCAKYAVDGECTDVTGCQIQLPSKFAKSGYRYLTADMLRAFNYSSADPTCVPEPQLASFQKAHADGLRIDFCNADQDRNAFTYNAVRSCFDYSKLCLVIPEYDTGTK